MLARFALCAAVGQVVAQRSRPARRLRAGEHVMAPRTSGRRQPRSGRSLRAGRHRRRARRDVRGRRVDRAATGRCSPRRRSRRRPRSTRSTGKRVADERPRAATGGAPCRHAHLLSGAHGAAHRAAAAAQGREARASARPGRRRAAAPSVRGRSARGGAAASRARGAARVVAQRRPRRPGRSRRASAGRAVHAPGRAPTTRASRRTHCARCWRPPATTPGWSTVDARGGGVRYRVQVGHVRQSRGGAGSRGHDWRAERALQSFVTDPLSDGRGRAGSLISEAEIRSRIAELGQDLARDYARESPLLVGVLQGAFLFMADLVRATPIDLTIDFMGVSSYGRHAAPPATVRILVRPEHVDRGPRRGDRRGHRRHRPHADLSQAEAGRPPPAQPARVRADSTRSSGGRSTSPSTTSGFTIPERVRGRLRLRPRRPLPQPALRRGARRRLSRAARRRVTRRPWYNRTR